MTAAGTGRDALGLEAGIVLALLAVELTWFAAWPAWAHPAIPFAVLIVLIVLRARLRLRAGPIGLRLPRMETTIALLLAFLYRLPALLHPWGFVNKDGAYGAFIALHLQQGVRPAPVFTEGANYQGTLKGHLGALIGLVTGADDLSWLIVAASVVLYLVFVAASMALARRLGGRAAAAATGLYLAISPRFLTVFSVNSVGQYVDVLALGGLGLALLARLLDLGLLGRAARHSYLAIGFLLGAAFWQQPVALAYGLATAAALAVRRSTWRDPWVLLMGVGLFLGTLPVLIWNVQNDWASSSFVVGREPSEVQTQVQALPELAERALTTAFPVLAGLSPRHPWGSSALVRMAAILLLPMVLAAYLALKRREIVRSLREGSGTLVLLPPLLMAASLVLFWSVAAGSVYRRPRYLLPVLAASAVHLGVVAGWAWSRPHLRLLAALGLAALLSFNVAGTASRLAEARLIAAEYERLVTALENLEVRTAYSDFSVSAPVTMFTRERILVSPRLGPTPAYESDSLAARVDRAGPDAYILPPGDDPERFAAELRRHGVSFQSVLEPLPIFYALRPRIRAEEVRGFRGEDPRPRATSDE